jgi:uncharacterized repeat protein (TIGR01451 family)
MFSRSTKLQDLAQRAQRHWLLLTVAGLAVVALFAGQPAFAADVRPDVNQTVPPPTPRPPADNNNDNNDSGGSGGSDTAQTDSAPSPEVTETEPATGTLTALVEVLALNVRGGPSTTFPVIGKFAQGDEVTVEGRNEAGDWWYVCCIPDSEVRGWISAELVTPNFAAEQAAALPVIDSTPPPAATPAPVSPPATAPATGGAAQGTVAGVNLNVRSGPSTDSTVLGKLTGSTTVSVLGRNAAGDWLYICCIGTPASNGWVSAEFITPPFAAGDLPEVGDDGRPVTGSATGALSVAVAQQPPFAVQGREIALVYTVSNNGAEELANVVLSSDLPAPLAFVAATAGAGGEVAQEAGSPRVTVTWPALPAGELVNATVRVRVADDLPNGTTFANLASVSADNGEAVSNGIVIGMPPALLPEFW